MGFAMHTRYGLIQKLQLAQQNQQHSPVAFRRHQLLQLLQALLRAVLLDERDRDDDNDRYRNADGIVKLPHRRAHHRRTYKLMWTQLISCLVSLITDCGDNARDFELTQQQQNERVFELLHVLHPRRLFIEGV